MQYNHSKETETSIPYSLSSLWKSEKSFTPQTLSKTLMVKIKRTKKFSQCYVQSNVVIPETPRQSLGGILFYFKRFLIYRWAKAIVCFSSTVKIVTQCNLMESTIGKHNRISLVSICVSKHKIVIVYT